MKEKRVGVRAVKMNNGKIKLCNLCFIFISALINLLKFVLSNESFLIKKHDILYLCTKVGVNTL